MNKKWVVCAVGSALLAGCGGGSAPEAASPSSGQVAVAAAPKVSYYAAARLAEQAAFGPTPALIAEIQAKGTEQWVDEQLALPQQPLDPAVAEESYKLTSGEPVPQRLWLDLDNQFMKRALTARDQLRWRVMWSLSQYIVVSRSKGDTPPGNLHYVNLLYSHAFGNYRDLLTQVTRNPFMGHYLDNDQNRPKSTECPSCAPNENYARELMQLFSIGVFKLNADGTPQRDARARLAETYTQADVEELARVLTGWQYDPTPTGRPQRNWGNWAKPMTPSTWPPHRDSGRKVVMGTAFPAGQPAPKDLDDAIAMLMAHPNIAPFVSLRLIQHLTLSDPSPAYVGRVAAVFRNNGRGAAGDLARVVRAVLLDPEARRGDVPGQAASGDGKFREPWLHRTGWLRGMGCLEFSVNAAGDYWAPWIQRILQAESVFGYYAPTDRAPGSNLLAPEQRLAHASELTTRLSEPNSLRWNRLTSSNGVEAYQRAGCDIDAWLAAYASSPKAFIDRLSARYFRGAMPPTLRTQLEQLIRNPPWNVSDPSEGPMRLMGYALSTPSYGVIK